MFITSLVKNIKQSQDHQSLVYKCLRNNLKQLEKHLNLNDQDFVEEVNRVNDLFLGAMQNRKTETNRLTELNDKLHGIIRRRVGDERDANGISQTQSFYLVIALSYMLIVSVSRKKLEFYFMPLLSDKSFRF